MKIGMVAETMHTGNVTAGTAAVLDRLAAHPDHDLLCFGEAYLQGFDAFSWDYARDRDIALTPEDGPIRAIRRAAGTHGTAVSVGYLEKDADALYSSQLLIGADGRVLDNYRRVSPGWRTKDSDPSRYREGTDIRAVSLCGKRVATALCGDLWHDGILARYAALGADILLWPVYVDFSPDAWRAERLEYAERIRAVPGDVLLVGSVCHAPSAAFGGATHFRGGRIAGELPMGTPGMLTVIA